MKRPTGVIVPTAVVVASALLGVSALATENFDLRYAPGIGGADMSAPVDPGLYLQVPAYHYHADLDASSNIPVTLPNPAWGAANVAVATKLKVEVNALFPRLTYMTTTQLWGATVGYTALLPLIQKKSNVAVQGITTTVTATQATQIDNGPPAFPGRNILITKGISSNPNVTGQAAAAATAATGSNFGIGDLELGVMLRWQKNENQIILIPNIILPTGKYSATDAVNGVPSPSMGKFYTFRPTLQFSHIGDGWDFGVRTSLSFNTTNTDTKYKSGSYANIDWAVMKDLPNQFRVGLQGYAVSQFTNDSMTGTPSRAQAQTLGKKGSAFAIGPAVSWIKGSGELLLEGKWLKEISVSNRPKGDAFWISVAKPFL